MRCAFSEISRGLSLLSFVETSCHLDSQLYCGSAASGHSHQKTTASIFDQLINFKRNNRKIGMNYMTVPMLASSASLFGQIAMTGDSFLKSQMPWANR